MDYRTGIMCFVWQWGYYVRYYPTSITYTQLLARGDFHIQNIVMAYITRYYLSPFFGLAGTLLSPYLGLCFVIGSFIHFLHDSIGVGWGVKWFFPFDHKSYMFLYKARFPTSKTRPTKLVYSWTDVQRTEEIKLYADPEWIRHMYLAVHPFGLLEYGVFAIGILTAILYR